jgi:ABC-type lipopolysaccharide export system ATPase subunit
MPAWPQCLHPAGQPFAGIDPIAVIEIQRISFLSSQRGIGVLITTTVRETLGVRPCLHHQRRPS